MLNNEEYVKKYLRGVTVYKLQSKFSRIHLKNIGGLNSPLILNFDDFSLLVGRHGSGKTTIVKAINAVFNNQMNTQSILNNEQDEGNIIVDVVNEQQRLLTIRRMSESQLIIKENTRCIMLDDAGCYLDNTGGLDS